jgi:hypothetical protein
MAAVQDTDPSDAAIRSYVYGVRECPHGCFRVSPDRSAGGDPPQPLVGKPRFTPPWEGSSQREVTTLPRV